MAGMKVAPAGMEMQARGGRQNVAGGGRRGGVERTAGGMGMWWWKGGARKSANGAAVQGRCAGGMKWKEYRWYVVCRRQGA